MTGDVAFLDKGKEYLARSTDLNHTVRDLVRLAAEAVGSNMGALYLLDPSREVLKPAVIVNLPQDYVDGVGEVRLGQQCCGRVALHRMPWYVDDIWNETLFPVEAREGAKQAGVRAAFSVPVLTPEGECLGALSVHFPGAHYPTAYEITRQELFANLIACALRPPAQDVPVSLERARPVRAAS